MGIWYLKSNGVFQDSFLMYSDLLPPPRSLSCAAEKKGGRKNVFSLPGTTTTSRGFEQWVIGRTVIC